ncbi:hypothetical protein ACFE04_012823 [Oxalis oulophora]
MGDNSAAAKLYGIRQIVNLKGLAQKWQRVALAPSSSSTSPHSTDANMSPAINRMIADNRCCDSDEEICQSLGPPHDVPKGYLAVYVGLELRRFIIPTSYLSHSLFKLLLEKTEEEFGFGHGGALTIPCEIETFKFLLKCIENNPKDDQPVESSSEAS